MTQIKIVMPVLRYSRRDYDQLFSSFRKCATIHSTVNHFKRSKIRDTLWMISLVEFHKPPFEVMEISEFDNKL